MNFRKQFNTIPYSQNEWNNEPSMTVPDMAMSIQEIARRYAQGRPVPKSRNTFYSGDMEYPNPRSMSEMDSIDQQKDLSAYTDNLNNELKKIKARKKSIADSKKAANQQVTNGENEVKTNSNEQSAA